jgi:hypothetical protein
MVPKQKPWPTPPEGPPTRYYTEGVGESSQLPPGQSHRASAVEAGVNIVVGFAVSVAITAVLLPAFGHQVTMVQNVAMTSVFTVASFARAYGLRRLFNWLHCRAKP